MFNLFGIGVALSSVNKQEGHKDTIFMEFFMAKTLDNEKHAMQTNILDVLLYVLAGSAMLILSVSFLLWLRF